MTSRIALLYIFFILRSVTPEVLSSYTKIPDDNVTEAIVGKTSANSFCRQAEIFWEIGVCMDEGYKAADPPIAIGANVYFNFTISIS